MCIPCQDDQLRDIKMIPRSKAKGRDSTRTTKLVAQFLREPTKKTVYQQSTAVIKHYNSAKKSSKKYVCTYACLYCKREQHNA